METQDKELINQQSNAESYQIYQGEKIAKMFNFNPISSEDWHFDHQIFVDNYYNNKESRPIISENLNNSFESERSINNDNLAA